MQSSRYHELHHHTLVPNCNAEFCGKRRSHSEKWRSFSEKRLLKYMCGVCLVGAVCAELVVRHLCCSVLQCVAVCCRSLQCVAVGCCVLMCQWALSAQDLLYAACVAVLQFVEVCVAVCCSVLQCVAVHRRVL